MICMTAIKTPSPYCRSIWMIYIRYMDRAVDTRQPPVHCTVVAVYSYGGQPYMVTAIWNMSQNTKHPPPLTLEH
jgi:hypothetical protein